MSDGTKQDLITHLRKLGRASTNGLISAQEFINAAFDCLANADRVCPEVVPTLWDQVPENLRGEFTAALHRATDVGFRWHPFYMGGGRPMTEDEILRDEHLRTA